jgi:hypothetical protein
MAEVQSVQDVPFADTAVAINENNKAMVAEIANSSRDSERFENVKRRISKCYQSSAADEGIPESILGCDELLFLHIELNDITEGPPDWAPLVTLHANQNRATLHRCHVHQPET